MPIARSRFALVVVAVGVLAGCAGSGPSDLDTPEVRWPDGAPNSAFEDDPAVVALREAYAQEAVAWNALDYSDPDLIYRWGLPVGPLEPVESIARSAADRVEDGRSDPSEWTSLGPVPMTVYEVRARDESTTVVACLGSDFLQFDTYTGEPKDPYNRLRQFEVTFFPDGSSTIADEVANAQFSDKYFLRCKDDTPVRGVFDPEPELFSGDEDDVKRPAPAEEYGFDNVS